MDYTDAPVATKSITMPQFLHRSAAEQHEKALKHHREAALLQDAGDARQADTHANIAFGHAAKALACSERALSVALW